MTETVTPPLILVRLFLGLRALLLRMAARIVPPHMTMFEHVIGVGKTMMLRSAVELKIAEQLAFGPKSPADLAEASGADADAVARLLRALACLGVFERREDGRYTNNRLAETLLPGAPMRDFLLYVASQANVAAYADLHRTVETGANAFERVHGTDLWSWFAGHPDEGRLFASAMVNLTSVDAPFIVASYPFGQIGTLCDIAGGCGPLLAEVLARNASVRGVLFDDARVLEQARAFLAERGVEERVERVAGSFFDRVPEGADAYLLKDILHNWDDARALTILGNCRRAMKPGQKLLVVEALVEPETLVAPGPLIDIHVMTVCSGGRQRSEREMGELLTRGGFRVERVIRLPSPTCVVEASAA